MRQKILLLILLCSLLAPLGAKTAKLVATYTTDNTLGLELTAENVRYQLKIQQAQDGRYLLKAPPFLQADIPQFLHVGELQPQGLFSRLLDPMRGNTATIGYLKDTSVSQNFLPSFEPKLSGFELVRDNFELITLSPMFNSNSPTGIGTILGSTHAYAAVLAASQNNILIQKNIKSFQVNWKELGYGQHMFFFLLGANLDSNLAGIQIKSGAFVQGAFDTRLGGGNTTSLAVEAKYNDIGIKYEHKLGGVGVKLKDLEDKANPQEKTILNFELGKQIQILGEYQVTTYSKPIYGGKSQERTSSYLIGVKTKYFKITSENLTIYEIDKGKVSYTTLSAKTSIDEKAIKLSTQIYRPSTKSCELHNTSFEMTDEHSTLEILNQKVKLKLNWTVPLSEAKLELSIDQDRRLSAKLEFFD